MTGWQGSVSACVHAPLTLVLRQAAQRIAAEIHHSATVMDPTSVSPWRTADELALSLGINESEDPNWRHMWIDLASLMNPTPYAVQAATPLTKVVELFCGMGLRHLPVVNIDSQVVGIITRQDIYEGIPQLRKRVHQFEGGAGAYQPSSDLAEGLYSTNSLTSGGAGLGNDDDEDTSPGSSAWIPGRCQRYWRRLASPHA